MFTTPLLTLAAMAWTSDVASVLVPELVAGAAGAGAAPADGRAGAATNGGGGVVVVVVVWGRTEPAARKAMRAGTTKAAIRPVTVRRDPGARARGPGGPS